MTFRASSRAFAVLILTFACLASSGQVNGIITSLPNGKLVGGAEVFINKTSIGIITDEFGQFQLDRVPAGFSEIVVYKKGFQLYRAPMRVVEGRSYNLTLQLTPEPKRPRGKSPEALPAFKQALLGEVPIPSHITILNEKQLQVKSENGQFQLTEGERVEVEYLLLGYRMYCYFPGSFIPVPDAAIRYEEMMGTNINQNVANERQRLRVFQGSLRHWLMSVVAGKSVEQGYSIERDGKPVVDSVLVKAASAPGYFKVNLESPVRIRYKKSELEIAESTLSAPGTVDVNKMGVMLNSKMVKIEGAMNTFGLASQLPLDYRPLSGDVEANFKEALKHFYEKVYVQTDKPYYYPGDPLWLKAYINYFHAEWRDSLSTVLHVEILSEAQKVIRHKMLRIENGGASGDFILPDTLKEGTYYLRAFTTLRRNFGDEGLFIKPFRILNILEKVDPTQKTVSPQQSGIQFRSQKQEYSTREKITLDFEVQGAATLSVSVTDAAQVFTLPDTSTITKDFLIKPDEIEETAELRFRVERGVSFYGQFLNNRGKPEKAQLSFIQWNAGNLLSAETGEDGTFWQTGLQFTDSAKFSYKSEKAKNGPYGKVVIRPREVPQFSLPDKVPSFRVVKSNTVQRIISEYEVPKDTKLLEEVTVTGKRITEPDPGGTKRRTFGRPDHVLTSKTLSASYANLLLALVGKVPGLMVYPTTNQIYFARAGASSITNPTSPMVTINDIPMGGDAGSVLGMIDPNIVESIEFTARLNSLYGAQGTFGVIAVYTKSGVGIDNSDPNFQTIKLPGYSKARKFAAPDYENPAEDHSQTDFRATIYWNPDLKTDDQGHATVSFFASDLPGEYRVIVEGVTSQGVPIRGVTMIKVNERR